MNRSLLIAAAAFVVLPGAAAAQGAPSAAPGRAASAVRRAPVQSSTPAAVRARPQREDGTPESGFSTYGRPLHGFPTYGSEQFAEETRPSETAASGAFAVPESFFYDNFRAGAGYGVDGGEPVSGGSGSPLVLPSARARARQLINAPPQPAAQPAGRVVNGGNDRP